MNIRSLILIFASLFSGQNSAIAKIFDNSSFQIKESSKMRHTFIFWVNGDSDRFRPSLGIGSKNIRIDKLDVDRILKFSESCNCNTVIFHDQRYSDTFLSRRKHFGSFLYAFAGGEKVLFSKSSSSKRRMRMRDHISFAEVNQDSEFLTSLVTFSKKMFPASRFHLIYRGHSFANSLGGESKPFDYSDENINFHKDELETSLRDSRVIFETVTFAACSMSNISFAKSLSQFSNYMIASQVNIPETGKTGFNFDFLKYVDDSKSSYDIAHLIGSSLLRNFETVEERDLYIRETPVSVIYLNRLRYLIRRIELVEKELRENFKEDKESLDDAKIIVRVSDRYLDQRRASGASDEEITRIIKFIKVKSRNEEFDFGTLVKNVGDNYLYSELLQSIYMYGHPQSSKKTGMSIDMTFD